MRWKAETHPDRYYEINNGFLFLPKCIKGEWRWLEKAKWKVHFINNYYLGGYVADEEEWIDDDLS